MPSCIIGTEESQSGGREGGLEGKGSRSSSSCDLTQMSQEDASASVKDEPHALEGDTVCNSKQKPGRARSRANWTKDEDVILRAFVEKEGKDRWAYAGRVLGNRTGKQCRNRWYNVLDPNLTDSDWTEEEERRLVALHREIGSRWAMLARHMPGRSENAIKNHWHGTVRCKDLRNVKRARNGILRDYIAQLSGDSSAAEASPQPSKSEAVAPKPEKDERRAKKKRRPPLPAAKEPPRASEDDDVMDDDVRAKVKQEDTASAGPEEGSPAKLRKRGPGHDVSSILRVPAGNEDYPSGDVMGASGSEAAEGGNFLGGGKGGRVPENEAKERIFPSLPNGAEEGLFRKRGGGLETADFGAPPKSGVAVGGWSGLREDYAPSPPPGQQGGSRWLHVLEQPRSERHDVSSPLVRYRCPDTDADPGKASHSGVGKGRPLRGLRGGGLSWTQLLVKGDGTSKHQVSDADVTPPCEVLAQTVPSTGQCFFTATRSDSLRGGGLTGGTTGGEELNGTGERTKADRCDFEGLLRSLGPPKVISAKSEHSGGVAPLNGTRREGYNLAGAQSGFSGRGGGNIEWWEDGSVPPPSGRFKKPRALQINNPAALPVESPHVSTPSLHETFRSLPTSSNPTPGVCQTVSIQTPSSSAHLPGASTIRSLTHNLPSFNPGAEAGTQPDLNLTSLVMEHINCLLDQQAEKLARVDPSVPESSKISSGEFFEQHSQLRAALEFLTSLTARGKPEGSRGKPPALPAKSAASKHSPVEATGESPGHSEEPSPADPFLPGKPTEKTPWALKSSVQDTTALKFWGAKEGECAGDATGRNNQDIPAAGSLPPGDQQVSPRSLPPASDWQPFSLQGNVEPELGATWQAGTGPVDNAFLGPTTPMTSDWDERLSELTWAEGGAFGGFQSGA